MTEAAYIDRPNRPLYLYALAYLAFLYVPVLFLPLFSFNDAIYIPGGAAVEAFGALDLHERYRP